MGNLFVVERRVVRGVLAIWAQIGSRTGTLYERAYHTRVLLQFPLLELTLTRRID